MNLFKFSFFDNLKNIEPSRTTNVDAIDEIIRGTELKSRIEKYRESHDKKLKMDLPLVTFSGVFNKRKKSELVAHSGLICLDVDDIPYADELKDRLKEEDYIHHMFISPSRGLKIIIKIDACNEEEHLQYFYALQKHFEAMKITIDKACKDVSRACFLSHDPTAFYNLESETLTFDFVKKYFPIENTEIQKSQVKTDSAEITSEQGQQVLKRAVERFLSSEDGEKHTSLLNQATHLGYYIHANVLTFEQCYKALSEAVSQHKGDVESVKDADKTIYQGLTYGSENPKPIDFKPMSSIRHKFWLVKKGKIKILFNMYYTFLNRNGHWNFPYNGSRLLVRESNNVVSIISKEDIIDFTMDHIRSLDYDIGEGCNRYDLVEAFHNKLSLLMSDKQLTTIDKLDRAFLTDTKDVCYKFYLNGILKITKQDKVLMKYEDVDGLIWESSIIDRQYNPNEDQLNDYKSKGDFINFVKGVSGERQHKELSRYDSMQTIIGYLLHQYKDPKNAKAIIFCDEQISDNPEGGVGKGVLMAGLAKYQKATVIDGKNFSFSKNFAFQQVDLDTKLLCFDDVKMKFDFKSLFSAITEGLAVEKKNKDTIYIKYEDSPKVLITTNYIIEGEGNSFERRKVEIEFSQHYNKSHTPFDEFQKTLFDDWDEDQWMYFDLFMTDCIQKFLQQGIITPLVRNIPKRKLRQLASKEFAVFSSKLDQLQCNGKEYSIDQIKQKFLNDFPYYASHNWFTSFKFNSWLKLYGEVYKYKTEIRYSNNVRLISYLKSDDE
jgi:hypothetical protein